MNNKSGIENAVFGGGCFWCLEAVFTRLNGVRKVISGYAGGEKNNPTYNDVCSGRTGHAEVVKIEYDPDVVSYNDLLTVFFAMHDPTTPNRQGADAGTQYRSIILSANDKQKQEAERFIKSLEGDNIFASPIVTEIKRLKDFYPAENYHQEYFASNPHKPYCQFKISPKIKKLEKQYQQLLKN